VYLASQLRVDKKYLHPLPMHTAVVVESRGRPVTVTLLNANHCPGAVMFLFQVGKRHILHVGDFRWSRDDILEDPLTGPFLRPFWQGKVSLDEIFLDTTYCDPKYTFPTQQKAIEATVTTALQEFEQAQRSDQRLLLLFGAYTIGKENVYMAVADRLKSKVYVDHRRRNIARALADSRCWSADRLERLTTNPRETNLWVVPMSHVNLKKLPSYLTDEKKKLSFDRVVGFRPTGWSHNDKKKNGIVTTTRSAKHKDQIVTHSIPYSEHSNFDELVDCLRCLQPRRIVTTVGPSKSQEQIQLLRSELLKNRALGKQRSRHNPF